MRETNGSGLDPGQEWDAIEAGGAPQAISKIAATSFSMPAATGAMLGPSM